MKKLILLALFIAATLSSSGQEAGQTFLVYDNAPPPPRPPEPVFTSFSINFPGGPPSLLVSMITNQTRKALNVIIPPEFAETEVPPLNMKGVTVPRLFEALEQASKKAVTYTMNDFNRSPQTQRGMRSFGFRTAGPPSEDGIWYFFVEDPTPAKSPASAEPRAPTVCRFFQMSYYLQNGYKVEDITTALDTAWQMLGENTKPKIKYHEDTNLLIVVGHPEKLQIIDEVLRHLQSKSQPAPQPQPQPGAPFNTTPTERPARNIPAR